MLTDPRNEWGECEIALKNIEPETPGSPWLDDAGVPQKAYASMLDNFRASSVTAGRRAGEPNLKGLTEIIRKRPPAERQGSGQVVVVLLPGYRYWRHAAGTGGVVEHQGRLLVEADEGAQIVGLGSASYA